MDPNQLTSVLSNCQSPDPNIRQQAEKWIQEFEKQDFPNFLQMLAMELANNTKPPETRKLAGLILKNALYAKNDVVRAELAQKWLSVDITVRTTIKQAGLATLPDPVREARGTAAQVVAQIGNIELPRNLWPELIPALLGNMEQPQGEVRQASLETLGYICEETDPEVLAVQADNILTAVCRGMKDPHVEITLAACRAMNNALEFVKANFEREVERNYIMQVLCDACAYPDARVRVASIECLVKIAHLYYDKLTNYMQKLFNISLEAIKKDSDEVAQQAIEFWCTICDVEIELNYEAAEAAELKYEVEHHSQNFIAGAVKYLVPLLTECLTRQEDEPEEDTWNVATAAGTCLSLVANTVGDEVVPIVVPFIEANINSENWKLKEAATLAFGAILEGPKNFLAQLISQAMPVLLFHMKDPVVYVKDTTAWTIGRVCQLHPQTVGGGLPQVITVLAESLDDNPRVSSNVCWAIHNLALSFESDDKLTSPMSPFFAGLVQKLMILTEREDADESNLRVSAYEAISVLIQNCAQDVKPTISGAIPLFLERLEKTFYLQILTVEDRDAQNELQSQLCGVLQVIIQKMGDGVKPFADKMMALFLQVFSSKNATVHEEALMAVGAIANAVEADFEKYMPHFRPFLTLGLRNYEEHQVCAVSVGVVGDVSRALGAKMAPYCDEIISLLLQDLQNAQLHRNVKPPILSCFGDIALAIGAQFGKYLAVVANVLQQASTTKVPPTDYDLIEYLNSLREGIFEAYTGIIQGLRSDNVADLFLPFVEHVVAFTGEVYADQNRSEAVTRGAIGVLGDLGHALGAKAKQFLQQPFVRNLLTECTKSDDSQTRDVAHWARDIIQKL